MIWRGALNREAPLEARDDICQHGPLNRLHIATDVTLFNL